MERPEREHLLLEVLEDDLVHAGPELLTRLAIPRIVRETAARGLELTRVEDELAGGRGSAGLGAGGSFLLGVCDLDRGSGRYRRLGSRRSGEEVRRRDESRNLVEVFANPRSTAVAPEVGRVLAEIRWVGSGTTEVHDVADFRVSWDLEAASAGAFPWEAIPGDGSQARDGRDGFGRRLALSCRTWMLAWSGRAVVDACCMGVLGNRGTPMHASPPLPHRTGQAAFPHPAHRRCSPRGYRRSREPPRPIRVDSGHDLGEESPRPGHFPALPGSTPSRAPPIQLAEAFKGIVPDLAERLMGQTVSEVSSPAAQGLGHLFGGRAHSPVRQDSPGRSVHGFGP